MVKTEYSDYTILSGDKSIYSLIPGEMINTNTILVFTYIKFKHGKDNTLTCSIESVMQYYGFKECKGRTKSKQKFIDAFKQLQADEIINVSNEFFVKTNKYFEITVDFQKIKKNIDKSNKFFCILYKDELNKIIEYSILHKVDVDKLLTLFCWIKQNINKRSINLSTGNEDKSIEEIRQKYPEANSWYIKNISFFTGICTKTLEKYISILEQLGLIYVETQLREYEEVDARTGKKIWRTKETLFSLTYKRNGNRLYDYGEKYYLPEIRNLINKEQKEKYKKVIKQKTENKGW